jgi:RNA polymerase sigma-70 factor (ECF subfamily)
MPLALDTLQRALADEPGALEALVREWQQPIGRFVLRELGETADAVDVCQTVFVKMVRGLRNLKEPGQFEPWLYRIARNACADHLRAQRWRRRLFVSLSAAPDAEAPADEDPEHELKLSRAIAKLSTEQRHVVSLSLQGAPSYEHLAGVTGWTVASVRNRLFRAREKLKSLLLEKENAP